MGPLLIEMLKIVGQDDLFVSGQFDGDLNECFCVNLNEVYGPCADAEAIPMARWPQAVEAYKLHGEQGLIDIAISIRGVEPTEWRKK